MTNFRTDISIFLGLLTLCLAVLLFTAGQSTVDIQLHDTYFVLDKISLTVLIIGPLTFLIFLARALTKNFKTSATNIGLIIGLALVALITYQAVRLQTSYVSEMIKLDHEALPDRDNYIADAENKIKWTWALFGLWTVVLLILAVRTIRITKEGQGIEP